ncbi:MAG: diguanylate cyclase domain-containing protein [Solirubrobacteraceae bacterium]
MSRTPFAAAALLAWIAAAVGMRIDWRAYAASLALLAVTAVLARMERAAGWSDRVGQVPASLAFLAAVALLRHAAGGITAGVAVLSSIPVFYTALSGGDRRQLCIVLVALAAFFVVPIVVVGPPPYPDSQYRAALVSVSVSAIVGFVTQGLVARIRLQATEAGTRERMLSEVGQVARALFDSSDPRRDLCAAPLAISDASVAVLLEPAESGALLATAAAGSNCGPVELPATRRHPAHEALRTGRARLIARGVEARLGGPELWSSDRSPASVLLQPVLKDGQVTGVLVVGWPAGVEAVGSRATVVALLAHEAALAIDRADQLSLLAGMAQTDPLTGLPNRRAWDARLAQAVGEGQEFAVAIIDLDHFKHFNDTFGHPAGDELLRDTAAAWREQLRTGDLLARLGGEEFGLLLFDCDVACASDVTERLRGFVTSDQTCSVGLALRRAEEAVDVAVARADRALYDAKAAGRDRACASV